MVFRQVTHDDLGCASYLIGDEHAGVAAVVDPKLDIDEYLRLARYVGVSIEHILETHNHADHVSGHGRLAAATGARIHVHRIAEAGYEHEPFEDGWELELGRVRVRALHTPGHRPEHTAFALIDTGRGGESAVARYVVGVRVGLEHVLDRDAEVAREVQILVDVEPRIDDGRDPGVVVADQIGGAAEIIVGDLSKDHASYLPRTG